MTKFLILKRSRKYPLRFHLSWILTGIILLFITLIYSSPEKIKLIEQGSFDENAFMHYDDLNNDGVKEKLFYHHYHALQNPNVFLYEKNSQIKEIWSLKGKSFKGNTLFCLDINSDGEKECYTFTIKDDKLWLHLIFTSYHNSELIHSYPVQLPKETANNPHVYFLDCLDTNQDKIKEILFTIDSDKSNKFIYRFDFSAKKITQIQTNIKIESIQKTVHSNNLRAYIALAKNANKNIYQIHQLSSELKVTHSSPLHVNPGDEISMLTEKNKCILLRTNAISNQQHLTILSPKGEIEAEKKIGSKTGDIYALLGADEKNIWLTKDSKLIAFNYQLEPNKNTFFSQLINTDKLRSNATRYLANKDLNQKLNINYLPISDELKIAEELKKKIKIQDLSNSKGERTFFLQSESTWYLFKIEQNLLFYMGIGLFLLFIIIPAFLLLRQPIRKKIRYAILRKKRKSQIHPPGNKDQILTYKLEKRHFSELMQLADIPLNTDKSIPTGILNDFPITEILHDICVYYSKDKLHIIPAIYPFKKWNPLEKKEKIFLLKVIKGILSQLDNKTDYRKVYLHIIEYPSHIQILLEDINQSDKKHYQPFLSEIEASGNLYNTSFSIDVSERKGTLVKVKIPLSKKTKTHEKKIKIIIAEDHDVSLFGLISLLKREQDIEIAGTAKNGQEVLALLKSKKADIVITDIAMPDMDGIELSAALNENYPEIRTIVFTMYMENWFIEKLLENKVKGFVSKSSRTTELIEAIKNAYKGLNYYCPNFEKKMKPNTIQPASVVNYMPAQLSKMETDILRVYCTTQNPDIIADKLDVSTDSVITFLEILSQKLRTNTPGQLKKYAYKFYERPSKNLN